MSDREYVKINTSIQTGSNAQNLIEDVEGNVQAEIELRLPDNLFSATSGAKKVDKVELLTTKMRVSMQNTPIAQIPIDTEHQTPTFTPSTCQLDVYPFCLIDDEEFFPKTIAETVFPNYRSRITLTFIYVTPQGDTANTFSYDFQNFSFPADTKNVAEIEGAGNNKAIGTSILALFQRILQNSPDERNYLAPHMNMCLPSNHENLTIENGELLIKHISALTQLWNDALENAMVTALRESNTELTFQIAVINANYLDTRDAVTASWLKSAFDLDTTNPVLLPPSPYSQDEPVLFYSSKGGGSNLYNLSTMVPLRTAFKPEVSFNNTSLSIAYDTAPFFKNTPLLWNPSIVETGNVPEQLKENPFLNAYTMQPPAKRFYVTPVDQTGESDERGIDTNLIFSDSTSKVFNIVCNRATRDTFSFLPWTEIPRNIAPIAPHLSLAEGEPFYLLNAGGTKTERSTRDLYSEGTGEQKIITERARVQQRKRYVYQPVFSGETSGLTLKKRSYVGDGFSFFTMLAPLVNIGAITEDERVFFIDQYRTQVFGDYTSGGIGTFSGYIFEVQNRFLEGGDEPAFHFNNADIIAWSDLFLPVGVQSREFTDVYNITNGQQALQVPLFYPYESSPKFEFVSETYEPGSTTIQYPNTTYETETISQGTTSYVSCSRGRNPLAPYGVTSEYGVMWTNRKTFNSYNWAESERPLSTEFQWYECVRLPSSFDNVTDVLIPRFAYNEGIIYPENFNACIAYEYVNEHNTSVTKFLCIQEIGKKAPGTAFGDTYLLGKNDTRTVLNTVTSFVQSSTLYRATLAVDMIDEINLTRRRASGYFNRVNQSVKVTTTWENLPIVVMSPIQSFVLTLQGVQVRQEYQPINRVEGNASSLTSSFPVIENYYTLASSLADLHDELVIIKDSFNDQALYSLPTTAGESRVLRFTLHYITKDGRLHKLFIPKKGIFALQLTFGITYYYTS